MARSWDLSGRRFGRWTVVKLDHVKENPKSKFRYWLCRCDCGNTGVVPSTSLYGNSSKSCGCLRTEKRRELKDKDIIGKKYNRLTVIERIDNQKHYKTVSTRFLCECECGNRCKVTRPQLLSNNTKSCGCLKKELVGDSSPNWKDEKVDRDREATMSPDNIPYRIIRKTVYKRDNYSCVVCGHHQTTGMHAHHLDGWHWHVDGRYDIDNMVTLCVSCHDKFHKQYGRRDNTADQFYEFEHKYRSNEWGSEFF